MALVNFPCIKHGGGITFCSVKTFQVHYNISMG